MHQRVPLYNQHKIETILSRSTACCIELDGFTGTDGLPETMVTIRDSGKFSQHVS
jgi:hypothetical protein